MPYYFMRDTPLQAMEQLMMSQPGQKPRGGGIYRSPFHYTPKDVACKYCQNYDHDSGSPRGVWGCRTSGQGSAHPGHRRCRGHYRGYG